MKKTLNINLNGIVFNIDEDAYNLLNEYLNNIHHVFGDDSSDADEIVSDFEARICELLSEQIYDERQVVTIKHIEEIITRMGRPDEFEQSDNHGSEYNHASQETPPPYTEQKIKRRLFRNPDNKIIGGVCSGIASYFDVDVTWVRLICVGLTFLTVTGMIFAYIVMLIVVPEAKTASDKLAMNGKEATIENIGKTVKNSFDKVSKKAQPYINQAKEGSWYKQFATIVVDIFSFIAKAIIMAMGVIAIPVVIALALAFVILLIILISFSIGSSTYIDFTPLIGTYDPTIFTWNSELCWSLICALGCIMSIGIPLLILIFSVFKSSEKFKPFSRTTRLSLVFVWILGIIISTFSIIILSTM